MPMRAGTRSASFARRMKPAPRPLRLLEKPEPIEAIAEVPDGPPLRFRWRRALHEVIAAEGPERIEGAWWSDGGNFADARLFSRRGQSRPALLAVPRRALSQLDDRRPCRAGSCTGCSRDALSRIRQRLEFLLPARRVASGRTDGAGAVDRARRTRPVRPQFGGRRGARASRQARAEPSRLPIIPARGWCSPTARPTSSPIRATAPAGAGSRGCSRSAT